MNKKNIIFISVILSTVLMIPGCGSVLSLVKKDKAEPVSGLSAGSILVDSTEIRSQTIELLTNSKKAIYIQLSSLDDPEITALLVARSQSGIEVRVLLDQWQRVNASTVEYLKNQNVSVQFYPAEKGQYHRVRYMVTDYQVAVFYGQDWLQSEANNHSIAVKLTGDTAWNIAESFAADWEYTTTLTPGIPEEIKLPEDNIVFALNSNVKQQVLKAINNAELEIRIEVEQVSEKETVEALINARIRGCDIKLIVSPSCAEVTPNTIAAFKDAQIDVRYFKTAGSTNNINMGTFDKKTVVITNSPWSHYSFVINHEGSLTIPSPQAVEKINNLFETDWASSTSS